MHREVRLVNDEFDSLTFEFFLGTPEHSEQQGDYVCEFGVSGIPAVSARRYAHGFDAMSALMAAVEALIQVANCLLVVYEAEETDFESANGVGFPFRRLPDLQMGMKLARSADFKDAPRFLLSYAAEGLAEAQLNLGTCLWLANWGDALAAKLAFEWFEKAALQGVGQAYWYMADIVERHPRFRNDLRPAAYYLEQSQALGFHPGGESESAASYSN